MLTAAVSICPSAKRFSLSCQNGSPRFFANSWETKEFKLARGLSAIFHSEIETRLPPPIEDREPLVTASVREALLKSARAGDKLLNSLSLPVAIIFTNELVERREEGELRVYRYLLTDLGRTLFCDIRLSRDGKIVSLQVSN